MSSIAVFALLQFGRLPGALVTVELISLGLILFGIASAVVALVGIPRHGPKAILLPALVGVSTNGLLLLIFVTNFTAARAREKGVEPTAALRRANEPTPRFANFDRNGLSFSYDTRYKIAPIGTQGQISLQYPDSQVVLTQYDQPQEAKQTLERVAEAITKDYRQQNFTDIRQAPIETVLAPSVAAGKVQLNYTRPPQNRIVADFYLISSATNSVVIAHYYPENRASVATSMFESVLASFLR